MKCPNCLDELKEHLHYKHYIDTCGSCGGAWFDYGELSSSIEYILQKHSSKVADSNSELTRSRLNPDTVNELKKSCPRCNLPMQKINYMYDSNVILDKCGQCGGLWADYGEFKKIASYCKGNPQMEALGKSILKSGWSPGKDKKDKDPIVELGNFLNQPARPIFFFGPRFIIPLKDDIATNIIPYGTIGLLLINILIFLLMLKSGGNSLEIYQKYGLVPSEILSGRGYLSFFSSLFLHGGFMHLLGNMFFLWIFADNVEEHLGLGEFIAFFIICGFWADIIHILTNADSTIPTVGASGAIAGIMGAYFYLFPHAKIKTLVFYQIIDIPAFILIGTWLALQLLYAAITFGVNTSVAFSAHIGGFFSGIFFIWLYENKIKPPARA